MLKRAPPTRLQSQTYLYEAENAVVEGCGGVVFGQNGTDQNPLNKLLGGHQNMQAMAAVLYAGLKNLREENIKLK